MFTYNAAESESTLVFSAPLDESVPVLSVRDMILDGPSLLIEEALLGFCDAVPVFGSLGDISARSDRSNSAASRETELDPRNDRELRTDARSVAQAYEPGFSRSFGVRQKS